jgi:hypothetical protein
LRFVRWRARLDDCTWLVFTDPRRFGHLDGTDNDAPFFAGLGIEPLSDDLTAAVLAGAARAAGGEGGAARPVVGRRAKQHLGQRVAARRWSRPAARSDSASNMPSTT